MSSVSHIEGVPMQKIMPEEKSPVKQFGAMIKTLEGVKDEAKLDNPNDCVLLTNLSFLMNKGSGSGVGQFPTGWKWDELGDKKKFKMTQGGDLSWKEAGFSLEEMKNILKRDDLSKKIWIKKLTKILKKLMKTLIMLKS